MKQKNEEGLLSYWTDVQMDFYEECLKNDDQGQPCYSFPGDILMEIIARYPPGQAFPRRVNEALTRSAVRYLKGNSSITQVLHRDLVTAFRTKPMPEWGSEAYQLEQLERNYCGLADILLKAGAHHRSKKNNTDFEEDAHNYTITKKKIKEIQDIIKKLIITQALQNADLQLLTNQLPASSVYHEQTDSTLTAQIITPEINKEINKKRMAAISRKTDYDAMDLIALFAHIDSRGDCAVIKTDISRFFSPEEWKKELNTVFLDKHLSIPAVLRMKKSDFMVENWALPDIINKDRSHGWPLAFLRFIKQAHGYFPAPFLELACETAVSDIKKIFTKHCTGTAVYVYMALFIYAKRNDRIQDGGITNYLLQATTDVKDQISYKKDEKPIVRININKPIISDSDLTNLVLIDVLTPVLAAYLCRASPDVEESLLGLITKVAGRDDLIQYPARIDGSQFIEKVQYIGKIISTILREFNPLNSFIDLVEG